MSDEQRMYNKKQSKVILNFGRDSVIYHFDKFYSDRQNIDQVMTFCIALTRGNFFSQDN